MVFRLGQFLVQPSAAAQQMRVILKAWDVGAVLAICCCGGCSRRGFRSVAVVGIHTSCFRSVRVHCNAIQAQ
jgi:hypothetical protein